MYLAAGLSKLWRAGVEWSDVDRFTRLILRHHFTHEPPTQLGVTIANHPLLVAAFAKGALLLELSTPLTLLGRLPRALILGGLALLQFGIWAVMGVGFVQLIPLFACVLPWEQFVRWVDRLTARFSTRSRPQRAATD
jgi:CBS domain containing-hemolysin-like protein